MELIVFLYASITGHNSVVSDFFQNIDFICEYLHLLEFRGGKFFKINEFLMNPKRRIILINRQFLMQQ